jgi:ditrans,polycis-polyprenyl diphosphate synthase
MRLQILEVCYKTGVKVVTIYAFSIENFKRSKHEIDALMSMAKVKLEQLAEHGALLDRYGASVRVLGQRNLLKKDVLAAVDKAVAMTAHNKKYVWTRRLGWMSTNAAQGRS